MSAERDVFKSMRDLGELYTGFLSYYLVQGQSLLTRAVTEFLLDHPEVATLTWSQRGPISVNDIEVHGFTKSRMLVTFIGVKAAPVTASALETVDPRLAKCLRAMEENFLALNEAAIALWGEGVITVGRDFLVHDRVTRVPL